MQQLEKPSSDERIAISLRECKKQAEAKAELDANWRRKEGITLRARCWSNLDFVEGEKPLCGHIDTSLEEQREWHAAYLDALHLERFVFTYLAMPSLKFS